MKESVRELAEAIYCLATVLQKVKEANEGKVPPHPPKGSKGRNLMLKPDACAREVFVKPTKDEVAAHIAAMGYTFTADEFWEFYEAKGWRIGPNRMRSWKSACSTWHSRSVRQARIEAARQAHIDAKFEEREARREARNASVQEIAEKRREENERRRLAAICADPHVWDLCRERCAHCGDGGGCAKGAKVPPDRRNPPVMPEECRHFAAKEVAR